MGEGRIVTYEYCDDSLHEDEHFKPKELFSTRLKFRFQKRPRIPTTIPSANLSTTKIHSISATTLAVLGLSILSASAAPPSSPGISKRKESFPVVYSGYTCTGESQSFSDVGTGGTECFIFGFAANRIMVPGEGCLTTTCKYSPKHIT